MQCNYHDEYGHYTKSCITLRKYLEDLAKYGHLQAYVIEGKRKRNDDERRPKKRKTKERDPSEETVDTIHGVLNRSHATQNTTRGGISAAMTVESTLFLGPETNPVSIQLVAKGESPMVTFSDAYLAGVTGD